MQPVDICNMALSEMGARVKINSLTDVTPAAVNCNIWYDQLRRLLLRSAPWGFARTTVALTQTGSILNNPPDNDYPWLFNYTYPSDCVRFRYLIPSPPPQDNTVPPVPGQPLMWLPWMMPSRDWRYVVNNIGDQRVITANLNAAIGIYNADITNVDQFDQGFIDALSAALAEKLILPLSGNVQMKSGFVNIAKSRIDEAKADDGNESISKVDHVPDWIAARGAGGYDNFINNGPTSVWGIYNCDWSGGYGS
jgi:hypothetical protein